ncbi:MAG: hypothetical protein J0L69_16245 [Bacteroidetes bacterium]|nr:hypothetical protein [Bacteroidota bacterium]
MIKYISDTASFRLIDPLTIEINYFDNEEIDKTDLIEHILITEQLSCQRKLNYLLIFNENINISQDAINFLADEWSKRADKVLSRAIISRSTIPNNWLDYFNISSESIKTKFFSNVTEARIWLKTINQKVAT